MVIIYNIGLFIFYGILLIAAIFNTKARKWLAGRSATGLKLKSVFATTDKVMWMHCSSLGEFEQGRPLLEEFRRRNPQYKILLTFFSPSGYELRKNYEFADCVLYLPLDTWFNARRFVKAAHPDVVFFVKYDLWYHHLHQAKKRGAQLYLISAVFRPEQAFFKAYGGFFRSMLRTFNHIFIQNNASKQLLQQIDINNVTLTGDTRIDRVRQIAQQAQRYPIIEQFINSQLCLVCGSTWAKDEEILAEATQTLPQVKLIIAPHLIDEGHVADIERLFSARRVVRYTQATDKNMAQYDVLIVDTIGMLSSIYQYGQAAYIGGGFIDGIHNTLEAAVYGIPVVFGVNYAKFIEAVDLVALGGAVSIADANELYALLTNWYTPASSLRQTAGDICKNYIWQQPSATDEILNSIGY